MSNRTERDRLVRVPRAVTASKGRSLQSWDHRANGRPLAPKAPRACAPPAAQGGPQSVRAAVRSPAWARSQGREAVVSGNLDTRIGYVTSGETGAFVGATAERSLLAALEAGRPVPAGAPSGLVADEQYSELRPRGAVGTTDATSMAQMSITGSAPASDGDACAPARALTGPLLVKCAAGPMGERTP